MKDKMDWIKLIDCRCPRCGAKLREGETYWFCLLYGIGGKFDCSYSISKKKLIQLKPSLEAEVERKKIEEANEKRARAREDRLLLRGEDEEDPNLGIFI